MLMSLNHEFLCNNNISPALYIVIKTKIVPINEMMCNAKKVCFTYLKVTWNAVRSHALSINRPSASFRHKANFALSPRKNTLFALTAPPLWNTHTYTHTTISTKRLFYLALCGAPEVNCYNTRRLSPDTIRRWLPFTRANIRQHSSPPNHRTHSI